MSSHLFGMNPGAALMTGSSLGDEPPDKLGEPIFIPRPRAASTQFFGPATVILDGVVIDPPAFEGPYWPVISNPRPPLGGLPRPPDNGPAFPDCGGGPTLQRPPWNTLDPQTRVCYTNAVNGGPPAYFGPFVSPDPGGFLWPVPTNCPPPCLR